MESYIVQIYRRSSGGALYGRVERVGNGSASSFRSIQELWNVLSAVSKPSDPLRAGCARNATNGRRKRANTMSIKGKR